jgi:hypothetical protein
MFKDFHPFGGNVHALLEFLILERVLGVNYSLKYEPAPNDATSAGFL